MKFIQKRTQINFAKNIGGLLDFRSAFIPTKVFKIRIRLKIRPPFKYGAG